MKHLFRHNCLAMTKKLYRAKLSFIIYPFYLPYCLKVFTFAFICVYLCYLRQKIFLVYWQASQSGSSIEQALGASEPTVSVAVVLPTAFSPLLRLASMVDFSTWVAPIERK